MTLYPRVTCYALQTKQQPSSEFTQCVICTHILIERCWDSKKHCVDFLIASNNCSYKNIKINVKAVNTDPKEEVRYINPWKSSL